MRCLKLIINSEIKKCNLCIRKCNVNRNVNLGVCQADNHLKVARAQLHFWEEPCISGKNGSGTVFFSHCNLKCVFCQNHCISQEFNGKTISIERLAAIFLELEKQGANNINLVTPTHYVPQIIKSIKIARNNNLTLPILYNTNSIDSLETIKALDGLVDVYLPDFKYFDDKYALEYSKINNYRENALNVIKEMVRQVGAPSFNDNGIIQKGVIVRHLLLPGLLFDSKKVIDLLYNTFHDDIYISLMNQYVPMHNAYKYPKINSKLNPKHYDSIIDYALSIGVKNGFIQGEGANTTDFVPSFKNEGV